MPVRRHRTERLDDLLRAELSELMMFHIRDPRVKLATVSHVEVTRDLSHATVKVSVLGSDDAEREAAVAALVHARGFLRSQLAERLRLRLTPELHFELDRGAEHSQRINEILEKLHDPEREQGS
jgi:ribosome-binding factor A